MFEFAPYKALPKYRSVAKLMGYEVIPGPSIKFYFPEKPK